MSSRTRTIGRHIERQQAKKANMGKLLKSQLGKKYAQKKRRDRRKIMRGLVGNFAQKLKEQKGTRPVQHMKIPEQKK